MVETITTTKPTHSVPWLFNNIPCVWSENNKKIMLLQFFPQENKPMETACDKPQTYAIEN